MTDVLSGPDWELLWRLRNAGLPIPLLRQPMAPFEVHLDPGLGVVLIYPSATVTTVAIPLYLAPAESVRISQCRLLINDRLIYTLAWEDTQAATVSGCLSNNPRLLLGLYSGSNGRHELHLRKGKPERGYVLLQGAARLPAIAMGDVLFAELWLGDNLGRWSGVHIPIRDLRGSALWEDWRCQRQGSYDVDANFRMELPEE